MAEVTSPPPTSKRPAEPSFSDEPTGASPKRQKTSNSPEPPEPSEDPTAPSTTLTTTAPESGKKVKKIVKKKKRPAPPQVDPALIEKSDKPVQTGTIFNIWYNKWSGGDREDKYLSKTKAPSRCIVAAHTGYTKADSVPGSYFCLFFARGICPKGRECDYLHRLPGTFDIYSGQVDCFGREKWSDYRDDMGGVGSFMRQNRTLYVGRIHPTDDIEEIVARHFQEWGKIERIRVLPTRGVAFVTYVTESLAQFAKEAMAHQSLDHDEVLNVRWATVDPNPASQKREARKIEEQAADAIRKALPEMFVKDIEGTDPEARQRRRIEGSFGLQGYEANDKVWFEHEKARMQGRGAEAQSLEGPDESLRLQQGAASVEASAHVTTAAQVSTGLLGTSTLAALQGYQPEKATFESKALAGGGLGLDEYGSDDE